MRDSRRHPFDRENQNCEALAERPTPSDGPIRTKSDNIAPIMPKQARRTPKREHWLGQQHGWPGVAIPMKETIAKRKRDLFMKAPSKQ